MAEVKKVSETSQGQGSHKALSWTYMERKPGGYNLCDSHEMMTVGVSEEYGGEEFYGW